MKNRTLLAGAAALVACTAVPALAEGKGDRAQKAIAEARGKIDAAVKAGTIQHVPGLQARAEASLRAAQEDIAAGHKEQAIADANQASMLADTAIGEANKQQAENAAADRANAAATTAAATDAAVSAQQDAAAANARANAAEQSAAAANAQAEALRNTPPPAPAPAPVATTTTVTTEKAVRSASTAPAAKPKRVVHRRTTAGHTTTEKTTTTVTTAPQ